MVREVPHTRGLRLGPGWWASFATVTAGFVIVVLGGGVLFGGLVMGGGFGLAAVLRGTLTAAGAAGLCVRSRLVDVVMYAVLALLVGASALLVHLREFV